MKTKPTQLEVAGCRLRVGAVTGWLLLTDVIAEEAKRPDPTTTNAPVAIQSAMAAPTVVKLNRQTQTNAQERLRPTSPDMLIERHGAVGAIFARPDKVNPLQLLNPLAPKEYGNVGEAPAKWSWDALVGPGQAPRPRGFQDDRFHEASAVLFNHGFR